MVFSEVLQPIVLIWPLGIQLIKNLGFKSSLKLALQGTFEDVAKNECNCKAGRPRKLKKIKLKLKKKVP